MSTADAIIAAEARAEQAEAAALATEIQLGITRARLAELETEAAKLKDGEAERAVRQLVTRGAIRSDDVFTQHQMKGKFVADPTLIPLAVGKPFNRKAIKPK